MEKKKKGEGDDDGYVGGLSRGDGGWCYGGESEDGGDG